MSDQWSWAIRLADQTGIPALGGYVRWRQLLESKDRLPFAAYAAFLRRRRLAQRRRAAGPRPRTRSTQR